MKICAVDNKYSVKALLMLTAAMALGGCAASATNERLDALENQLSSVQRTADQALDLARQAQSTASGVSSDASEAQRQAQQALDTATETAERVARMADECCGGK